MSSLPESSIRNDICRADLNAHSVGLSTAYYASQGLSIHESVRRVVALGFSTVELGAAHAYEADVWTTLHRIREEFPEVTFTVHTLFPPLPQKVWFNPADGLNEQNVQVVDHLYAAAEILDARLVSLHPAVFNDVTLGQRTGRCNFDVPEISGARDRQLSISMLNDVLSYVDTKASASGIGAAIENLDNEYMRVYPATSDEYVNIFENYPNVGMLLDVGHATSSGNLTELLQLCDNVRELHLHDVGDEKTADPNWAHMPFVDDQMFTQLASVLEKPTISIFEHGADIREDDIRQEHDLLLRYLGESSEPTSGTG